MLRVIVLFILLMVSLFIGMLAENRAMKAAAIEAGAARINKESGEFEFKPGTLKKCNKDGSC